MEDLLVLWGLKKHQSCGPSLAGDADGGRVIGVVGGANPRSFCQLRLWPRIQSRSSRQTIPPSGMPPHTPPNQLVRGKQVSERDEHEW